MFPIRDTLPTRTRPVLTYGLIAANLLVFLLLGSLLSTAVWELGAVSFQYTGMDPILPPGPQRSLAEQGIPFPGPAAPPELVLRSVSHMFLHGGLLHLLGNLWFLWIFADNVEDRLGRGRFLLLYLLSGLGALGAQVFAAPASAVPMVGASGAISGVLGAYLLLFPQARIVTLVPIGFIPLIFLLSARIFLLYWFGLQFVFGLASDPLEGGVAWWAHVGGFATGMLLAIPLTPRRRRVLRVEVHRPPPSPRGRGMPFALLLALGAAGMVQAPPRAEMRMPASVILASEPEGTAAHVRAREELGLEGPVRHRDLVQGPGHAPVLPDAGSSALSGSCQQPD